VTSDDARDRAGPSGDLPWPEHRAPRPATATQAIIAIAFVFFVGLTLGFLLAKTF
jgi:hypothetical protein